MIRIKNFLAVAAWVMLAVTASASQRPNILIAISDDQSHVFTSFAGYRAVSTPAFDRVAREGIFFRNAFAPSPGCSPTRAAFLTGRHTWQIENAGTHDSSFPAKYIVFPDLLEQAGYFVGMTGKGWGPGNFREDGRPRNPAGPAFADRKLNAPHTGMSSLDYAGNFADFLAARPKDKPFYFWYGASEPHRGFAKGSGLRTGKKLADATPPPFLPDTPEIRSDILDYCLEIEWFDSHLARMLEALEKAGELDNTLVIVTSDNGMPFPRAKANLYEYGFHEPLAIRWGAVARGGRAVDDLVGFVDLTATILEAANVSHPSREYPPSGRSLLHVLKSERQGLVDPSRTAIYAARERHSSSRYNNWTYPQRAIRTHEYLYVRNFRPDRWPAGDPVVLNDKREPAGPHSGYKDIDPGPSLDFLIQHAQEPPFDHYLQLAVAKRPAEELFDIRTDPACLTNLAANPAFSLARERLGSQLEQYLRETKDPRVLDGGEIWETYKRYSAVRQFPAPTDSVEQGHGSGASGESAPATRSPGPPGILIDHSPKSSGLYIGSPGLAILPNGDYLASHDFFGPGSQEFKSARSVVFRSGNKGAKWQKVATIQGAFWSSLFVHRGVAYLMGTDKHHGRIVIRRSTDSGSTWTDPLDGLSGVLTPTGEYHTAPVPVLEHNGRLWRGFEDAGGGTRWGERYRAGMLSVAVNADLLVATNWVFSNFISSERSWNGGDMAGWLEGNAVLGQDGDVLNILRVDVESLPEKVAVVKVSGDGKRARFDPSSGFVSFPGGAKKFTIRFDEISGRYWSIPTIVQSAFARRGRPASIRNTLALSSSSDLKAWTVHSVLLQHPDVSKHGFQYVDWLLEGNDIIAACRTAFDDAEGGAHNNHDANYLTFHRIQNFRGYTNVTLEMAMPEGIRISGSGWVLTGNEAEVSTLVNGAKAFANRDYVFESVPSRLEGWQFTRLSGGVPANLVIRPERDLEFVIATAAGQGGIDLTGWSQEPLSFSYTDANKTEMRVFKRRIAAGAGFRLPQGNWTGSLLLWSANGKISE